MAKRQATVVIDELKPVVESLIFASDEPLSAKQLRVLIEGEKKPRKKKAAAAVEAVVEDSAVPAEEASATPSAEPETLGTMGELAPVEEEEEKGGLDARTVRAIVDALNTEYTDAGRAFLIVEIAGGFMFATRKEYGVYVGRLAKDKSRRRLSQAALETLAIVAYRQPISKPDVEAIRGVNCDEVLSSLMERALITITGRAESVGRPLLYGTTDDFLKYFGLVSLKDLPRPREIDEMMDARGILDAQATLELSAEENVEEIEEHLTHHFPAEAAILVEAGLLIEEKLGDGTVITEEAMVSVASGPDPESDPEDDADDSDFEDEMDDDEEDDAAE